MKWDWIEDVDDPGLGWWYADIGPYTLYIHGKTAHATSYRRHYDGDCTYVVAVSGQDWISGCSCTSMDEAKRAAVLALLTELDEMKAETQELLGLQ